MRHNKVGQNENCNYVIQLSKVQFGRVHYIDWNPRKVINPYTLIYHIKFLSRSFIVGILKLKRDF